MACDLGFAPFCFKTVSGETTGFSYDLAAAVAEQLGRPGVEAVDSNFSAIFAGLFSKRFEMIAAPTSRSHNSRVKPSSAFGLRTRVQGRLQMTDDPRFEPQPINPFATDQGDVQLVHPGL